MCQKKNLSHKKRRSKCDKMLSYKKKLSFKLESNTPFLTFKFNMFNKKNTY